MRYPSRDALGRMVVMLLTAAVALGCAHPATVYRSPAGVLADGNERLDLRLVTGQRYVIRDGRIQNDTLYAVSLGRSTAENTNLAVPLSAVASLARTERGVSVADAAKFTLGAVTIAAALAAAALILALSEIK